MSGRDSPMPPKPLEQNTETADKNLAGASEEARDMLASYAVGCKILEEVEASMAGPEAFEEAERRLATVRRQVSAALLRLSAISACSEDGALAKIDATESYLAEFPMEDRVARTLMRSVFTDVRRILWERRSPSPDG